MLHKDSCIGISKYGFSYRTIVFLEQRAAALILSDAAALLGLKRIFAGKGIQCLRIGKAAWLWGYGYGVWGMAMGAWLWVLGYGV